MLAATDARAGGGFGSAWMISATDSSITIDWSDPSGKYRHASSPPSYKVCYKEAGAWIGSCSSGEVAYTQQKPYMLSGLDSNKTYKIKVFTYAERKNWRGRWKNPEYRKVGTLTQATSAPTSNEHQGDVQFVGATSDSISVSANWSHPEDFEFIRICYKKAWSLIALDGRCNDRDTPWDQSNAERGWFDIEPAVASFTVQFGDLGSCRQYIARAYGFHPDTDTGLAIGSAKGHTGGTCKTSYVDSVLNDHEELMETYLSAVRRVQGESLFDHLQALDGDLRVVRRILSDDETDLGQDFTMMEYLVEERSDLYESWQAERALVDAGLPLVQFVATRAPDLHAEILDETRDETATEELDLSAATSVAFTLEDLAAARGFGAHVSTSARMDGFGGTDAECYVRVLGSPVRAIVQCYDGAETSTSQLDEFTLELGPVDRVSHVTVTITRRQVAVEGILLARPAGAADPERAGTGYVVRASFPIRESSGFFAKGRLFFRVNGVLSGRADRAGSGFVVEEPEVR